MPFDSNFGRFFFSFTYYGLSHLVVSHLAVPSCIFSFPIGCIVIRFWLSTLVCVYSFSNSTIPFFYSFVVDTLWAIEISFYDVSICNQRRKIVFLESVMLFLTLFFLGGVSGYPSRR
jgi:hypothetical protein